MQHPSPQLRSASNSVCTATPVLRVLLPRLCTQQGQSWNHYFSWPTLLLLPLAFWVDGITIQVENLQFILGPSSHLPLPLNCLPSCLHFNIILVSWPYSSLFTAWVHTHILPWWNVWISLSVGAPAFNFPSSSPLSVEALTHSVWPC